VLPLIKTLFDIVLLRKGPEDIPRSSILFILILGLWLFSSLAALALIEQFDDTDFFLGLFSAMIGVLCYAVLVAASGHTTRLLQTISAILGCGALISLAFVAEYVLFLPFLGEVPTGLLANLILLWSVPVEGHIIARAIDRHWYIGILIAIGVFVLQYIVYSAISSPP
jgi:peptidoglycan/LPS O-acetylase OafA/YrhL